MNATVTFAMDRANRWLDADGRLHVAVNRISKATVNPYYGREIPGAAELGLDPNKTYNLLRHPEELAKGAETSNNIPLMDTHVIVSADDPQQESVVGSTGTDAVFNAPYLENSLVIWTDWSIEGVMSREQCELSCAYRYVVDLTPGTYEGLRYDGIMRNIVFNHVALVREGRAGPDVVVGDSKGDHMPKLLKSRKAILVQGALATVLRPILAADQKVDLSAVLQGVNGGNYADQTKAIAARLNTALKGKTVDGADLKPIAVALDAMVDEECAEDEDDEDEKKAEDEDPDDDKKAEDESEEDKDKKAEDGETDDDPKAGKAMDAKTVNKLVAAAEDRTVRRMNDIADAKRIVSPYIGEVTGAVDSAEAVYKLALDHASVKLDGTESLSALRTMVGMLPRADAPVKPTIALDAAANDAFSARFPDAKRIGRA